MTEEINMVSDELIESIKNTKFLIQRYRDAYNFYNMENTPWIATFKCIHGCNDLLEELEKRNNALEKKDD